MKKSKITSAFQYVFLTVVCLTSFSGGYSVYLASRGNLTPEQTRVFETFQDTWNKGTRTIFGLLGGTVIDLLDDEEEDNSK